MHIYYYANAFSCMSQIVLKGMQRLWGGSNI